MIIGIDPKIDLVFRILFGQSESVPILMELLNAILEPLLGTKIVELEILNPFTELMELDDKACVVDVKARDSTGRLFDLEMQRIEQVAFKQRALFYWSRLHGEQLKSGEKYEELKPTILVCIADFVMFEQPTDYLMQFELYNRNYGIVFSSDILVVTIELPKYAVEVEAIKTPLEAWVYFLREGKNLDNEQVPTVLNQPGIRRAMERLSKLSQSEIEMHKIRDREKYALDELSRQARERRLTEEKETAERNAEAAERNAEAAIKKAEAAEAAAVAAAEVVAVAAAVAEAAAVAAAVAEKKVEEAINAGRLRLASVVVGLLSRKIGALDAETIMRIEELPVERLELLGKSVFELVEIGALKEWLLKGVSEL